MMYTGFDSISLRRSPTEYRARALGLAAVVLINEKSVHHIDCSSVFRYLHEDVFCVSCFLDVGGDIFPRLMFGLIA